MKATLFLICLVPFIISLEIPIVDEDYVIVPIGGEKKELKLLIDPVGHFTYLLKPVESSTKILYKDDLYSFENHFGEFKGHYESDFIFPTKDKNFGFQLRYLMIDTKNTVLEADGVLGLGYSDDYQEDTNIYKILSKMDSVFKFKKVMTYDKKNKKLILGTVPEFDSFNPVAFDIKPNEDYPFNLVDLSKIGFTDKKGTHYVDMNTKAKFGLIPAIIAPEEDKEKLEKELMPYISEDNNLKIEMNKRNLFNDIFFDKAKADTKAKAVMLFGISAYKFDHTWKDESGKLSSTIRLGGKANLGDYWYIGIDKLNINRADFDFEEMKVTMYSPTAFEVGKIRLPYLIFSLLVTIAFLTILAISIRYCCSTKRQIEIRPGEELLYL
ncbi:MAG: hypothetical protein MJ252_11365 [archaeon]|nr:hypothetical protein [archaeon]